MLHTWRFTFRTNLVPLLLYSVGPRRAALHEIFACTTQKTLGNVYLVSDYNSSQTRLHTKVPIHESSCEIPTFSFRSSHYSAPYTLYKLDMLRHLPSVIETVVLIDTDVIVSSNFVSDMTRHLTRTSKMATMSISSAGGRFYGLQAGVIAFRLSSMRMLGETWWNISGIPRDLQLAEQTLWDYFATSRPHWIGHLPCGFHLETQVLQAALIDYNLSNSKRFPSAIHCPTTTTPPQILHGAGGMARTLEQLAWVLPSFGCNKLHSQQ